MWFLVITNIIGWAIAVAALTMLGLTMMAYGASISKSMDTQRPNIHSRVKLFNTENNQSGKSVPETGSL
jgi:hypothetical protein